MLKKINHYLEKLNNIKTVDFVIEIDLTDVNADCDDLVALNKKQSELITQLTTLNRSGYTTHSVKILRLTGFVLTNVDLIKLTQSSIKMLCLQNCTINKSKDLTAMPRKSELTVLDLGKCQGEGLSLLVVSFICTNSPHLTQVNLKSTNLPLNKINELELRYNKLEAQSSSPPLTPTSSSSSFSTTTPDSSPRDKTSSSKNEAEEEKSHTKKSREFSPINSTTKKKKASPLFSLGSKLPLPKSVNPSNNPKTTSSKNTFK